MFKKNILVGVSVTPEVGLEVAQIDFATKTVLKYQNRQLAYDNNTKEIADLDLFKETLQELLTDMEIPKGSDIALTLPAVTFRVNDYPASLNKEQIIGVIEEDLAEHHLFQDTDPCLSAEILPNSTMQFNKVAYTASPKVMLIEVAMQISTMGYNLVNIDSSVNATLNALIYQERIDTNPNTSWVMLLIENNTCRILSMQGTSYVDAFEERVSIGQVLDEADNYSTVVSAVNPILKNIPSQYLFIVSKTDIISAEVLATKLSYNAPIIHFEANSFGKELFLPVSENVDGSVAKSMTLDVVGAAINREMINISAAPFNMFNESLGDIYTQSQPPVLKVGTFSLELSMANMVIASIAFAVIGFLIIAAVVFPTINMSANKQSELQQLEKDITQIQRFLKENENISSELFDEGDEIKIGLQANKNIYTYYTIVGTEIPKKLWLTSLSLGEHIIIKGQADNLESVYSFFRNIKDYDPNSGIKLQKLGLASKSKITTLNDDASYDTESILTSMNADFYEFLISNGPGSAPSRDEAEEKVKNNNEERSELPDVEDLN